MPQFHVIGGKKVREIIEKDRPGIETATRSAYMAHHLGDSTNPDSYFLRFPKKKNSRIIALPSFLGKSHETAGIKWISSFPDNIESGLPRASAVVLLNDYRTGYPFACLEGAQISAARTSASAVLAAGEILRRPRAGTVGIVGAGIIARNIVEFFRANDWDIDGFAVFDREESYARSLAGFIREDMGYPARVVQDRTGATAGSDVCVLTTTAAHPHITDPDEFGAGQLVLNISLRDLSPEVIMASTNILDDIEHCLKADTSPHLAEQKYRTRDFISGTLAEVITGDLTPDREKPIVFSPFGLGVLDLAVALHVYRIAEADGGAVPIDDFFAETQRW